MKTRKCYETHKNCNGSTCNHEATHTTYRGRGVDRLSWATGAGRVVYWTRNYATWEAAQRACERGLARKKWSGDRYAVEVKATGEA